jgi:hypothetical protein
MSELRAEQRDHAALHKDSPWFDDGDHRARDAVFIAAIKLHKAFIDAAAKPLRHNLNVLMKVFSGKAQSASLANRRCVSRARPTTI